VDVGGTSETLNNVSTEVISNGAVRLTMSGLISAEIAEQVQCTAESPISAVQ